MKPVLQEPRSWLCGRKDSTGKMEKEWRSIIALESSIKMRGSRSMNFFSQTARKMLLAGRMISTTMAKETCMNYTVDLRDKQYKL